MGISAVLDCIGEDLKKVSCIMRASLESDIDLLNTMNRSILSSGGKMVRPMITLLSALSCAGRVNEDTLSCAASTELLHNATLLHDDVVDNSNLRRGKPTVMSILGPGPSVLIGDYWLVNAVDLVLNCKSPLKITRRFAKTLSDLASGEMLQMQCSSECNTSMDEYLRIIYSKTASLFETAGVVGAISVDSSPEYEEAVREYSCNLGMAFQMKDDILDYEGSEKLGKPAGQDLKEQKVTLPLFGAFANAGKKEEEHMRKLLSNASNEPSNVEEILSFVKRYDGMAWADERLVEWSRKATDSLCALPESKERDLMAELASFVVERNS